MATPKQQHQKTKQHLGAEDKYETRCGEIFITFQRVLVFQCSFCDEEYRSADFFLEHLITHTEIEEVTEIVENENVNYNSKDKSRPQETSQNYDTDIECETLSDVNNSTRDIINPELVHMEDDCLGKEDKIEFDVAGALDEELHYFGKLHSHEEGGVLQSKDDIGVLHCNEEEKPWKKKIDVFTCHKCNKIFRTKPKLKRHMSIHSEERNHKCTICGFAFKERNNLLAHLRRHRGEKNLVCDVCSKRFFTRSEIEKHKRTHTGEKPYICAQCGMTFADSTGLGRHTKQRHSQEEDMFKCTNCEKRFWNRRYLSSHLLVHTKEKPFPCSFCSARFPLRRSLVRHEKLHQKP